MTSTMAIRKGPCSGPSDVASRSFSAKKLVDYTKNRARFVGEKRRKKSSLCSDFQSKMERAGSKAREEDEESASISTAGSTELVVFLLRRQYRQEYDDDDGSCASQDEDYLVSHSARNEDDPASYVSESETPSETGYFGYLPGAIRKTSDQMFSPLSIRMVNDNRRERTQSLRGIDMSLMENDHSSASYNSHSESSSQLTSTESLESSAICGRSVRSNESIELGLLSHSFVNRISSRRPQDSTTDDNMTTSSFSNNPQSQRERSFRSLSSRSITCQSLDSLASNFLLKTPTSHKEGKSHIPGSAGPGCHVRSSHVHTPSSVTKSKYLKPFTPSRNDQDKSQRSAKSTGTSKSGRGGDKTVSLIDFFRKEEVKRFNPNVSKRSMRSYSQKSLSHHKPKSSDVTSRRKRAASDLSAPETPVTASMTSQTLSTPSNRGLLRSFSFSDKGNSILAELNQTLKQGLLSDVDHDDAIADDASIANSEALGSLIDDLRHVPKSSRALDVPGINCVDDSSSCIDPSVLAGDKPFLPESHSDSNDQNEIDNSDRIIEASTCNLENIALVNQIETLHWIRGLAERTLMNGTDVEMIQKSHNMRKRTDNDCIDSGATRDGLIEHSIKSDDMTQPKEPMNAKKFLSIKSNEPPAGFLIQPKVLPLRKLPKGTLPFAQLVGPCL